MAFNCWEAVTFFVAAGWHSMITVSCEHGTFSMVKCSQSLQLVHQIGPTKLETQRDGNHSFWWIGICTLCVFIGLSMRLWHIMIPEADCHFNLSFCGCFHLTPWAFKDVQSCFFPERNGTSLWSRPLHSLASLQVSNAKTTSGLNSVFHED